MPALLPIFNSDFPVFSNASEKTDDVPSIGRFEPDIMLPGQFNDLTRRPQQMDGETRLVLAVLEDAVRTYVKTANSRSGIRGNRLAEVSSWFDSRARYPFSFEYSCEVLGMNAAALRKRLAALRMKDFPAKQIHSVGRRQVMRPARYLPRKRSRAQLLCSTTFRSNGREIP
jgi:hypothetical protein